MTELKIDTARTRMMLVEFIDNTIKSAGFNKIVLGLSGGLDSALSCYLAAEAVGARNVLAIRMPYRTSNPDSLTHAQLVIDALGVEALTLPLTNMVEPLFGLEPEMSKKRKGNILARQRMILLYDQSEVFQGLVLGSGNKTEILLGYSTLYGDSACAFNALGDLYKTQVRELSAALGVPDAILQKPPSADLWPGQTDEDELGFTYTEVDKLLYQLVEEKRTPQDCINLGFAESFVRAVVSQIRATQFKRQAPPIARLSKHSAYDDLSHLWR